MSRNDFEEPQGDEGQRPPTPRLKGLLGWLLIGLLAVAVAYLVMHGLPSPREFDRDTLERLLAKPDAIQLLWVNGNILHGRIKPGEYLNEFGPDEKFSVHLEEFEVAAMIARLTQDKALRAVFRDEDGRSYVPQDQFVWQTLLTMLPWMFILLLIWFFVMRQMRAANGPGGVLSFGRSRARLAKKELVKITFDDVAGIEDAKEEVQEIVEFLRHPERFHALGGRIPRGVMLVGPPGSGKTLLAKAIAGEANVPFFSISGSDFVEMFVGVGASRVRDLFRMAKESSPCIIFLDEIDAVGRRRGMGYSTGGHDEREQTLNAILVEMDGFETNEQVIVVGATNRPDVLDPALRRPGRFDREVVVHLPDINEREAILKVHAQKILLDPAVDLLVIARGTPGFSGADLAAIINEAAIHATMADKTSVQQDDLEEARDKVRWGRTKRSRAMDEEERRLTAYHEAGHALMSLVLAPDVEPLHKVSIIPRGMALGATMFLPEKDRYTMRRRQCLGQIQVAFAGRVAEELFCDDITSGASNDIRQATELARRMVADWGMSDRIGPIRYSGSEESNPWGGEFMGAREHSDATAREIDSEIQRILSDCYAKARGLLQQNRDGLARVADALIKHETLTVEEVQKAIGRGALVMPPAAPPPPAAGAAS
jgi:cell division protease FtsH